MWLRASVDSLGGWHLKKYEEKLHRGKERVRASLLGYEIPSKRKTMYYCSSPNPFFLLGTPGGGDSNSDLLIFRAYALVALAKPAPLFKAVGDMKVGCFHESALW